MAISSQAEIKIIFHNISCEFDIEREAAAASVCQLSALNSNKTQAEERRSIN